MTDNTMTMEEVRQQILESDEFVLSEVEKLKYAYGLKHEIRYEQTRTAEHPNESVAEHIYGIHVLAQYFLPLEDAENEMDVVKVMQMITWHDIDELETGDMLGQFKTDADRARGNAVIPIAISKLPGSLQHSVETLMQEFIEQKTREATFVKAADKIEAAFEIFNESYKTIFELNKTTLEHHNRTKYPYLDDFPYMRRFVDVITTEMVAAEYFIQE